MTVKHLQTIQRTQLAMAVQTDPTVLHKFKSGFADCTDEVSRYISQIDGVDTVVKQRLLGHLNNCVGGLQQISPLNYGTSYRSVTAGLPNAGTGILSNNTTTTSTTNYVTGSVATLQQHTGIVPLQQDVNNNGRIQMGGVQLIPSRLPTGELALVMPNSSNLPYFPSSTFQPTTTTNTSLDQLSNQYPRISAFNSVPKSQPKHLANSPPLSPASSMSSGEDSMPSVDYKNLTTTPPLQTLCNVFPTPPSAESIHLNLAPIVTTTVQQPHITSTTGLLKIKPLSVITNTNIPRTAPSAASVTDVLFVNKKRPYPVDTNDDNIQKLFEEPARKILKSDVMAAMATKSQPNQHDGNEDPNEATGDMWRPW